MDRNTAKALYDKYAPVFWETRDGDLGEITSVVERGSKLLTYQTKQKMEVRGRRLYVRSIVDFEGVMKVMRKLGAKLKQDAVWPSDSLLSGVFGSGFDSIRGPVQMDGVKIFALELLATETKMHAIGLSDDLIDMINAFDDITVASISDSNIKPLE